MIGNDLSAKLAYDVQGLESLKRTARERPDVAAKDVAKQFDAMFINQLLKQMRESTSQGGLMDSSQSRTFTSMLDQQLSQSLATKGVGVADMLLRQLQRNGQQPVNQPVNQSITGAVNTSLEARALALGNTNYVDANGVATVPRPGLEARVKTALETLHLQAEGKSVPKIDAASQTASASGTGRRGRVAAFFDKLADHAAEASRATGIPSKFILSQAALESGWGKSEIRTANGGTSHNLFGIKATGGWKGPVAEVTTTEYVNGAARKVKEKFRVYGSYAEAFTDYAKLLTQNPRYASVVNNATDVKSFAHGLQQAGYATDPNYANKIMQIVRRIT